ncbi:benzaldehyde dehydrogenase [Bradyrhizobium sp. LTSPM299]|uniref:benzaldehyde dehydrogenase n=1 Tax=Bradyrhizobium sp. LTSPM299 TaxID=1619233 RepID=UPI0005C9407B|nr:benzaldehyde dehydrogenase [Bradyrhizobium sp. LTSPM299]KJC54074.1 benzaldehyde dehydrogenase [Bradyrhizobium sp. LTSPM299]
MLDIQGPKNWTGKIFGGRWIEGRGGEVAVVEPATGNDLGQIGVATSADVDDAAARASSAQREWNSVSFKKRAEILRDAAGLLRERADLFNSWNIRECGSIEPKASWELDATYDQIVMAAALPMQPNGLSFPSVIPGRCNSWRRIPVGIVGVIAPWNFPLLLAIRSVAPALALGNAVILKPDLKSAITGGALLADLFADAGLPPDVFQVLPGAAETGDALVRHPAVNMISFTGSTAVGRRIGQICGGSLKKYSLELGGNNPIVVMSDADIDSAVSCAAWGSFLHQGQICMQAGRHIVDRRVADEYTTKLAERARRLVVGNPAVDQVHVGPLINAQQAERVARIVTESIAAGADLVTGGSRRGNFFEPTVLANVMPQMSAFKEEIFGPVAPVTVFDSIDEAVDLVHASEYGLAAAVHSRSVSLATAVAHRLRSGMIHINDQTVNNEFHVPFGGMGASGNGGRFGGPANVDEFTQTQWISAIDTPIQYPF